METIASKAGLARTPNFADLRKSIDHLQHSSYELDKRRGKAERALIKALKAFPDHKSQKQHVCAKRRWKKLRTFVKRTFGVTSSSSPSTSGDPAGHPTKRSVQDVRVGFPASGTREGQNKKRSLEDVRVGHLGAEERSQQTKRGIDIKNVRLGKAVADWASRKRSIDDSAESEIVDIEKVRGGHAGAHRCHSRDVGALYSLIPDLDTITAYYAANSEEEKHRIIPDRPTRRLIKAAREVRAVNQHLATFERGFISKDGIKDREWYKHLGVAPGKWLGNFFRSHCS